jgi:hypothetical protein
MSAEAEGAEVTQRRRNRDVQPMRWTVFIEHSGEPMTQDSAVLGAHERRAELETTRFLHAKRPLVASRARKWARRDQAAAVGVLAIVALGLALRVPSLTDSGLWRDDSWTALASRVGLGTAIRMGAAAPGFTLAERTWIGVDQGSSLWAQLLPLAMGVAGIIAVYFLLRYWRLARWLALTAAFVVAVSPIATQYSTHVKQYSTDFVLACFLLWRAEAARRSPSTRNLVWLGAGSVGAVFISGSVVPVLVGSWVAVLLCNAREPDARKRVAVSGVAVAAFLGLVYLLFFRNLSAVLHRYWETGGAFLNHSSPTELWHSLGYAVSVVTVGLIAPAGQLDVYGDAYWTSGRVFVPAVILVVLLGIGLSARGRATPPALTLAAAVGASFMGAIPLGTGRTDEVIYPAVVLLGALGLHQIVRFVAPRFQSLRRDRVLAGGVLGVAVVGLVLLSLNSNVVRHPPRYPVINVRQLAAFVAQHRQPADGILVDPYTRYDWTLYEAKTVHIEFGGSWGAGYTVISDQPQVVVSSSEPWEDGYDPRAWVSNLADSGRLWYVGTWFLARKQDPVYQALLSQGWKPQGGYDGSGGFAVLMTGGGTPASALVEQGILAQRRGQFAVSEARFLAAMAKHPADVNAPYDLGVLYQQRLHDKVQAATSYKRALELIPPFGPLSSTSHCSRRPAIPPGHRSLQQASEPESE